MESRREAAEGRKLDWTDPDYSWRDFSIAQVPPKVLATVGLVIVTFTWSYWPTIVRLVKTWETEQDYAHGFLVPPIALVALWMRRDLFPKGKIRWSYWGLAVLGLCVAMRYAGGRFYLDAADGWSILLWVSGVCLLLGGWHLLRWCLPAIGLLWFMIPMPYAVDTAARVPLQRIATKLSSWILQVLGQPAFPEGVTLFCGEHEMEVQRACSGLRIFVTIIVMAFAYIVMVRPPWWERIVLIVAIVPVALLTNALRIVITAMLYQVVSSKAGQTFSHDLAGFMMLPIAGGLFFALMWYVDRLFREVEVADMQDVFRRQAG